jgi:lipopolysaccharide/colanic/teichoic acid biosynthesis glycosyltransferase
VTAWKNYAKRLLDISGSGLGILICAPVLIGTAAAIRLSMGSPVLFRQRRTGLDGRSFDLLKFRTMRPTRGGEIAIASDAARLTQLGSFLRESSIDELPTLWNVLRGEMSLVGPRPLLMQYLKRYTPEQARRHLVKPGITGWTQVNGRNSISWEEKFALDVWYVDHQSLMLDFKILAMTILKVLRREGISAAGSPTMPEFFGGADNHTQPAVAHDH